MLLHIYGSVGETYMQYVINVPLASLPFGFDDKRKVQWHGFGRDFSVC